MKEMLSSKKKFKKYETVSLNEECSAILQKKLSQKLKDLGSFMIPCTIGSLMVNKALCDLGASTNLMPLSLFRKLDIGEVQSTMISLQLADRSLTYPRGVVVDVLVKVSDFIFPTYFVVLDMEEDVEILIILRRPFLAMGRALIDVYDGKLTFRVNDEEVKFNIFCSSKPNEPLSLCQEINKVDGRHSEQSLVKGKGKEKVSCSEQSLKESTVNFLEYIRKGDIKLVDEG
ncbi:uncharacterized protein LOC120081133 [Benincasa hispida]|uniref:uncharacterized protein LOC120081133 n=1 Tax=Benincasa hispida TaxID=102211 RepID=UPI001901B17F|nr:uncharacterized protein LOC120081133 [Benincasa hispida]